MIPLAKAQKFAAAVVDQLRPHCRRIEIAGSVRRERREVGDVDLVIEAASRHDIERLIEAKCRVVKRGEQYVVALHHASQIQLDLWFSHNPQANQRDDFFPDPTRKPDNFGTLLLCRTGSTAHNIVLAERARRLGLHWNPHWGIYRHSACIASATEADIYRALGMEFMEPTAREIASRADHQRLVHAGNVL